MVKKLRYHWFFMLLNITNASCRYSFSGSFWPYACKWMPLRKWSMAFKCAIHVWSNIFNTKLFSMRIRISKPHCSSNSAIFSWTAAWILRTAFWADALSWSSKFKVNPKIVLTSWVKKSQFDWSAAFFWSNAAWTTSWTTHSTICITRSWTSSACIKAWRSS